MLFVNATEALWITVNGTAITFTLIALVDALQDQRAAHLRNGPSRTLNTRGNVRREALRLVILSCFLGAIVPFLFVDNQVALDAPTVLFLAASITLMASTAFDFRDRRRLAGMKQSEIAAERKIAEAASLALARVAEAEEAASARVIATAAVTASELIIRAPAVERGIVAAERTAKATERIADAAGDQQP